MSALPTVLVTRPAADAARWVEQLRARGLAAQALPLIDIAPVLAPSDLLACWQRLPQYAALVFVSGNAVDHFFDGAALAWPAQVRCLSPGPGTGRKLRERGVPGACIDEPAPDAPQFDSESLWQLIGQRPWSGRRVLVVRGRSQGEQASSGRDWLMQQLEQAQAQVEAIAVYERRAPQWSASQLEAMARACADGSLWLLSSSQALAHLPAGLDLSRARALATHPRIAQAARNAGFLQVFQSRPTLSEVIASIKSSLHD